MELFSIRIQRTFQLVSTPGESAGAGIKQKKLLDADGNPGVFVQSQGGGL